MKIEENMKNFKNCFSFEEVNDDHIKEIFSKLDSNTSTGEDQVPTKLVKLAKPFLIEHIKNSVNSSIKSSIFPSRAKKASVTPIDKGGNDKLKITNYRPVSVLNTFSKFYEKVMKNQIMAYFNDKVSPYLSAYRQSYNSQHVLIRLIEQWKEKLDQNYFVGAVLMDLSKAFDCVPHDLTIAKLSAYGFDITSLQFILSYLTDREQFTKVDGINSPFEKILTGVPQGSILGPIIFNIFINDMFYFINNCELHNYADDNTLSAFSNTVPNVIKLLETDTNESLSWLKKNKMIANPDKFQAIILSRSKEIPTVGLKVNIGSSFILTEDCVKLLGVTIDNRLSFDRHITSLCKKASAQMNALFRLSHALPQKAKKVLVDSFVYANFTYCPLTWHFSSYKSISKIELIHKRALKFLFSEFDSSYSDLLARSNRSLMSVNRLKCLCIEVFKTIHNLNPPFMKRFFQLRLRNRETRFQHTNNLNVPIRKTVRYGTKSLSVLAPRIWNGLCPFLKNLTKLSKFKTEIKHWNGSKCFCSKCRVS